MMFEMFFRFDIGLFVTTDDDDMSPANILLQFVNYYSKQQDGDHLFTCSAEGRVYVTDKSLGRLVHVVFHTCRMWTRVFMCLSTAHITSSKILFYFILFG